MKVAALVPELYCDDIDSTIAFYERAGFTILYQRPEERFAYLKLGEAEMMFEELGRGRNWIAAPLEHPYGRGINFQILVDDVEGVYAAMRAIGAPLLLELEEKWYRQETEEAGNKQFVVQDPDGYLLRFYEDVGVRPLQAAQADTESEFQPRHKP